MTTINWGILGAGNISGQFAHDLVLNNSEKKEIVHIIASIGCSSTTKGESFIKDNMISKENNGGIAAVVQNYDDFYKNKDIDVVYIGTPHIFHKEQVLKCLENGLHVLCEKPMNINAKESRELQEAAKKNNLFLMEAVWTRFLPIVNDIRHKVFDQILIGDVYRLMVDFSYDAKLETCPPGSRIRDKNLGAGALLDIGIYCITYARLFLDQKLGKEHTPFDLKSMVTVDPKDEVDYNTSILMKYSTGKQAILTCTNYIDTPMPFARLEGTKGYIELFAENPARLRSYKVHLKAGESYEVKDDSEYLGFIYEADAVAKDIKAGKTENAVMPFDETLLVMDTMDQVRSDNGFSYPMD